MSKKKQVTEHQGEAQVVEVEALDVPDRLCSVLSN